MNDIVTPYDLTSYAKDALTNYLPGLVDDAHKIDDDHPARFTERGDIRESPDYGKRVNRRLHAWAFARLQGHIEAKAREAGIPVEYVNAAVNIGDRLDPWGESLPLKPAGDDIPRNGCACDSTRTHRETSEKSAQMTLPAFHGSEPAATTTDT